MLLTDPNNPAHWGNPTGFMVGTPQDMASITSVPIPQVGDPRVATSVPFPHVSPEFARHIPGIFAGESGGDYDALFGFSNRPGGRYNNVRLTDMTVAEALEFANPRGDYGQWVAGQVGRVATPMGAYQVVGTTLRAAMEGLGLTGNERMTPELQDRIGQWIYENQGIGAWEGYRAGVTDMPTPPANARATSQGGQPMQQPGLLATMSTMNQQPPRDPSIWDALVGRLPERAQGFAGRTIGDADWRDRLAIGLAGMSMRPNEALIDTLQGRMDDRSQERRINQTAAYLESIGRPDLAAAMMAGLEPNTAIAEAMRPPEQPRPIEINGQLVDPVTGQVIGDYRDPGGQNREMRPDQNGVLRYVDDGTEVFPGVTAPVGPALSGDQLTAANTLRDDLTNNLRPFELSREGWQSVQTFYTNPGGVSDKALVVAFAKILDPGSVVREGESAAIASAGSLPVALQQQLLAALDGRGQLPQAVREEIAALSADLYKNQATRAGEVIENFRGVADQAGLPFESVYLGAPVDPRAGTAKTNNPAPSRAPAQPSSPPPATTAPPPATGAPAGATPAATTPPPSVPVAPSYAANQTLQAMAQSLGITIQEMWDMLPEEERAEWLN